MKLEEFFDIAVEAGKKGDSRTEEEIKETLNARKELYDILDVKEKELFDTDELTNLYADSGIYFDSGKDITKIFVGIDAEVQEIILADRVGCNLVFGHHPEGKALLKLGNVMEIHREALIKSGITVNVAERLIEERQEELHRGFHGVNYNRAVESARLLNMSFVGIHTPADNVGNKYMTDYLNEKKPEILEDIIKAALEIEEYKIAAKDGAKPKIISGSEKNRVGRIFVKFNGGTSGNKNIFKYLEYAGISTFICMHLPESHLEEAKKYNINVIVMPHMASDSLGINLILDEIEKRRGSSFEIVAGSGFTRIKR